MYTFISFFKSIGYKLYALAFKRWNQIRWLIYKPNSQCHNTEEKAFSDTCFGVSTLFHLSRHWDMFAVYFPQKMLIPGDQPVGGGGVTGAGMGKMGFN